MKTYRVRIANRATKYERAVKHVVIQLPDGLEVRNDCGRSGDKRADVVRQAVEHLLPESWRVLSAAEAEREDAA